MNVSFVKTFQSNYLKILEWGRLVSLLGAFQVLVQVVSFVCGLLIIRLLPTSQYALYTLANLILGSLIMLADGGITMSLMAHGGKVWKDRKKLGAVVVTGYHLRKRFALVLLVFAVPLSLYLFIYHNAGWVGAILLLLALVPTFLTALSGYVLTVGPALHQAIVPIQKVELGLSLGRILLLLLIFIFPFAFVAILSAGLPHLWGNIRLRKISAEYADWNQKPDSQLKKEILEVVKKVLPRSVFNSFSSQISIWLITIFGTTAAIAEIGALGRLSFVLVFLSYAIGTLIIPRFSRLGSYRKLLMKNFFLISAGLLIISLATIFLVALFPTEILWVLGEKYSGLESELVLSITGGCSNLFVVLFSSLAVSRNWALNPILSIPITIATMILASLFLELTTLRGVLQFNLLLASTEGLMYFIYCILKINAVIVEDGTY